MPNFADAGALAGGGQTDAYTQQLLTMAQNQGGAVAQAAAEAVHPNGSFLSMAKDKLGDAFHGVLDALRTPEAVITSIMSNMVGNKQQSTGEVLQSNTTPSSLMFGKLPQSAPMLEKGGMFAVKFVVDALLDPLSYATFGEYDGLMGLSKLSSIPLGPETAKVLGYFVEQFGKDGGETLRHHALSPIGQEVQGKVTTQIENTIKKDTLEQFNGAGVGSFKADGTAGPYLSADNIRGRITKAINPLIGAPEKIEAFLKDPRTGGAEAIAASHLKFLIGSGGLAVGKKIADMLPEEIDSWRHAVNTATQKSMDDQAERLVRHTIQARRSEIDYAVQQNMKRIIEQNVKSGGVTLDKFGKPVLDQFGNKMVKDLAQTYLDKGGFKMFGQSVVSGVRIRSALQTIKPLEDSINGFSPRAAKTLAAVSQGRNLIASAFSTNWTSSGRIPDTVLQMMRVAKFKQDAKSSQLLNGIPRLYQKLGISQDEDKLIAAAIVGDRPPTSGGDARLQTLWALLHNPAGNQVATDIANGVYGDDVIKMWRAARAIKDQLNTNLISMHESGMAAFPQKNYLPLLLNEPKNIKTPFTKFKTAEAANAQKGELNKWVNVKDPDKVLYGTEDSAKDSSGNSHSLERLVIAEERKRIGAQMDREVLSNTTKRTALSNEIEELCGNINEKLKNSILKPSEETIKAAAGSDKYNTEALTKVIRESIPNVDREKVMSEFQKKLQAEGEGVMSGTKLTVEQITKLRADLKTGDEDLDKVAQHMLDNVKGLEVKTAEGKTPVAPATEFDKTLKSMRDLIKENGIAAKQKYLQEALGNDENFKKVMAGLSDEWMKDPQGIRGALKSILGRQDKITDLMEELEHTKTGLQKELEEPGLKNVDDKWVYMDKSGEAWKRVRATAQEINDNLFDSKEMFTTGAIRSMLGASMNTLRTVNTKNLLTDIAEKFGVPHESAPSNFVKVSIADLSKEKGDLADLLSANAKHGPGLKDDQDLYYHPAIAEAIGDMMRVMDKDPVSNELLKSYDTLTNLFKSSVTTIFPAFYGRNAMSNVWQSMMDIGYHALSPANHMMAAQLQIDNAKLEDLFLDLATEATPEKMQAITELSNKVVLTDKRGYEWTAGELNRVIRDNVIAFHPSILGMMDTGHSSSEMLTELEEHIFADTNKWGMVKRSLNPTKQNFLPFQVGRNVANWTESEPRILNFLANLKNTGDVSFAAHQTKQFLYDHANLTPFERNFLRRVVPFYSYTRKNMEGMVQTLIHKPGRIASFSTMFQNIGDVLGGGNLSDQERAMLPEWMRDSLDIVVKRNGQNVSLLTTLGTPFEAPFDELGNLFGSLNPLIKGPVEAATGYSFFEGKPLSQVTDATAFQSAPQAVKDFIGFTTKQYTDAQGTVHTQYVSLNPRNMNLFQNMPFTSRILSSLQMLQNPNIEVQNKALANIIGVKPTAVNLGSEEFQRQKELDQQLETILSNAGVGYQRTNYTAPRGTTMPELPKKVDFMQQ